MNGLKVPKGLGWVLPFLVSAAVVYLHGEYVSHAEVQQVITPLATHVEVERAVTPLVTLPFRVERLEDYRKEAKEQQQLAIQNIGLIQQDMAAMKSQQTENSNTLNRILRRLDQLADQRGR